jgi:hypothetical protein
MTAEATFFLQFVLYAKADVRTEASAARPTLVGRKPRRFGSLRLTCRSPDGPGLSHIPACGLAKVGLER